MLESTRQFLIDIHNCFDELGFRPESDDFSLDDVIYGSASTISRCYDFDDATNAISLLSYVCDHFDKAINKISKHYDFWKSLEYKGQKELNLIPEDAAGYRTFATNCISKNTKLFQFFDYSVDDHLSFLEKEHGVYDLDDYYFRQSKLNSDVMIVFNKSDEKILSFKYDVNRGIIVLENKTNFVFHKEENGYIGIYDRNYYESADNVKELDDEYMYGGIYWDILTEKVTYGLAQIDYWDNKGDYLLFVAVAVSLMILFDSTMNQMHINAATTAAIVATLRHR